MKTIQEMIDQNKGEAICARLRDLGLKPVWLECVADRIGIGIEFVSGLPTWTKAFHLPNTSATPDAFVAEINNWKNEVRRAIVSGSPSTVVRKAIGYHGMGAILDAMEDTSREPVR